MKKRLFTIAALALVLTFGMASSGLQAKESISALSILSTSLPDSKIFFLSFFSM